jgi:ergothioneine biosynthesis protein EgtB
MVGSKDILKLYTETRLYTEKLCSPLEIEDYVTQVTTFTSPIKWHLGHVSWFFEDFILKKHLANYAEFDQNFNFIFNSYYRNIGEMLLRPNRGDLTRPTVKTVYAYRLHIDKMMIRLLQTNPSDEVLQLIILGINHEQQHQELLLTDIKYTFGHNPIFPEYDTNFNLVSDKNQSFGFVSIDKGVYQIGYQDDGFCYDNELKAHKVYINKFEISKSLITNAQYIEFIDSGAYDDFNLWLEEGWCWVQKNKVKAPLYWHKIANKWHYYTLSGLKAVDDDAILAHISFYEADAFARWKNMRLATEFEWEVAADKLDWGKRWEWTSSAYLPYPNYKQAKGAVGEYNGKFMNNQMVLRGSSVATSKNHSRKTYRNFFYSDERWQFNGIRLVKC